MSKSKIDYSSISDSHFRVDIYFKRTSQLDQRTKFVMASKIKISRSHYEIYMCNGKTMYLRKENVLFVLTSEKVEVEYV